MTEVMQQWATLELGWVIASVHYSVTIGKQLPSFPHRVRESGMPTSEVGGECVTTVPPWPLAQCILCFGSSGLVS